MSYLLLRIISLIAQPLVESLSYYAVYQYQAFSFVPFLAAQEVVLPHYPKSTHISRLILV